MPRHGVGLRENNLHQGTGLRNEDLDALISTNLNGIVNQNLTGIGAADAANDFGAWPAAGLADDPDSTWQGHLPVAMTPSIGIYAVPISAALPADVSFRIRARGKDQFGDQIEEITPWMSTTLTTTSLFRLITLSKVFACVDNVWVATKGISEALLSSASVGWHAIIDPTRAGAPGTAIAFPNYHGGGPWTILGSAGSNVDMLGTWANWGVGTRLRHSPYGPAMPFPSPEILGAQGIVTREKTTPTVINETARLPARLQLAVAGVAPTTGVCIGRSVAGWQGCPDKFGFFSNNAWTTKIAGIELGGSGTRAADTPTTFAQLGEDELQLMALLRTWESTRRGSNPTNTYVNG